MTRPWIAVVAAAGVVGVALLLRGEPRILPLVPPCLLHRLTGLYCPGCGSLRAARALARGNIGESFRMNPLLALSIPFILGLIIKRSWAYKVWVPWAVLLVLVAYGVLRNVGAWPLCLLAPH